MQSICEKEQVKSTGGQFWSGSGSGSENCSGEGDDQTKEGKIAMIPSPMKTNNSISVAGLFPVP